MMPNKSIYRDADAAEINLYELNFARFFSIQTSENGWRRVVCELVRRAAKGTKELRLEDGTELPGEKTFPDYVVDLMDSYLAVLPDAKPHAYPAAEREQLMERHCRHTEDGGIDYDYYQDMTLDTFIFNMRNVGAGALYAKRGPFWHGGHMEQCHFEELFRLIEEEGEKVFGETQERYADLAANDITAEDLQVFAVGAVDLAHRYDLDLIPGVGGIGQDRGNGVVGRFRQGLRVVYRLCRIGVNGEVAVQRDRRYIDTFHGKYIPFLPQWAASFL